MKQHTITTFNYDELGAKAQEKARDWFRHSLQFDGETTIEDAKQCFAHAGFEIEKVYFSGFSSQGDGACFEGKWKAAEVDPAAMRAHAGVDTELHRIADELAKIAAAFPHSSLSVKHRGHYYHQFCTDFTVSICDEQGDEIDTPAREDAEKALIDLSRDAMAWIYSQLEKDWDYENADEQIAENIRLNDYAFTEEGKRSVIL